MEKMLRVPEAARRARVHDDTVRAAIRRGELPAVRAFNRMWVREEDLEQLFSPCKTASDEKAAGRA